MKKRFLLGASILLATMSLVACGGSNDEKVPDDGHVAGSAGLVYTLSEDEDHYIFTSIGTNTDATVTVGNWYNNLPVTEMGEASLGDGDTLKTLIVSEGITTLAFRACRSFSVEKVVLPNGIEELPMGTFVRCDKLETIVLGKGLKKFNEGAAFATTSIKTINFRGTEAEWNAIEITNEADQAAIAAATVNFNYTAE